MGDHVIDRLVASYYVFDRILRPSGFTWGMNKWLHELEHPPRELDAGAAELVETHTARG